jgi:subtilisin-like proprotein convertase family protein
MKIPAVIIALFVANVARGQVLLDYSWTTFNGNSSMSIPDHNATGVADSRSLISDLRQILHLDVWVQTEGGFNGDLYLTLQHGSDFAVLMNRPGRTESSHFGYDDSGFNVTFRDAAANGDIHTYRNVTAPGDGLSLTGAWQPDGRTSDPAVVLNTSPRTAFLGSFNGQTIGGDWTLFAADLSSGGEAKIIGWGLTVTVVPEPERSGFAVALALGALWLMKGAHQYRSRRYTRSCG